MTTIAVKKMNQVVNWWDRIWFAPVDLLKLGLFRFVLGCLMLWMYSIRAFAFKLFFTDQGLILGSQARDLLPDIYRPAIQLYSSSETITLILYALFLFMIVLMILGIGGRITSGLTLVLHLSFIQRDFPIIYGVELMIAFWLFYLTLVQNNRYFSLWNLRGRGKMNVEPVKKSDLLSSVGARMMMLQLCIIYGYTGAEKLKGGPWWDGTAIWSVLGNRQLMTMDFRFLQSFPILVGLLTFGSMLFELYFPALIWSKRARPWVLRFGVVFHAGIASMMGLVAFSAVMITSYCSFLDDAGLRQFLNRFVKGRIRAFIAND